MEKFLIDSLCLVTPAVFGLLCGIICNYLFTNKPNVWLKRILFGVGITTLSFAVFCLFRIHDNSDFNKTLMVLSFILGFILIVISFVIPTIKRYYSPRSLNKIINKATEVADRKEIKLLAGDLSFFGLNPLEIEKNSQYICLKKKSFQKILILCETPKHNTTKICYGKILNDFNEQVELKFYEPDIADLQIRGRLYINSRVKKLLIFTKKDKAKYKAIVTDTASESGALYDNIWNLIWSLAKSPTEEQKEEYITLFENAN
ncbi:MAG: hypothetical protein PHH30_05045 [Bacteroidales bacterium]|nr:hypothetical protein [Bacteroidales bacterium]MDD3859298.1 hypothetical protein [Bacteroidales bacterium]